MSTVKDTAIRQYARLLNGAAQQLSGLPAPMEGWIAVMRKALGMSAPELARRTGVTKAAIYQAERKECDGGVTLQHMNKLAEGLGGRFVYAIVPDQSVENVLQEQARKKAEDIVRRVGAHMALENQALTPDQMQDEIARVTDDLLKDRPSDFWKLS